MSAGDKIQCSDIDEALEYMDELIKAGWDVDFEYRKGCKVVLVLKGRDDE